MVSREDRNVKSVWSPSNLFLHSLLTTSKLMIFWKLALDSKPWVLPPLSNSWIMIIIWLYIALNRTPNIDCYWGAVPNLNPYDRFREITEVTWPILLFFHGSQAGFGFRV